MNDAKHSVKISRLIFGKYAKVPRTFVGGIHCLHVMLVLKTAMIFFLYDFVLNYLVVLYYLTERIPHKES